MEEKKPIKISLYTFVLIIAIIIISVIACCIYINKTNADDDNLILKIRRL